MWSQDEYIRTCRFAALAHQGQTVPGTKLPYILHPTLVSMEIIAALSVEKGHDENLAMQCALLHDVIEDTQVTYEQVKQEFGQAVADGVLALSKDKTISKQSQMPDSLKRIKQQPAEIWMVKLADRISNLQSPPPHWAQDRIRQYREEAITIHAALGEASPLLASRLLQKIEAYQAYIK